MTVICIMILAYLIMGKDISGLLEKIKNVDWHGKINVLMDKIRPWALKAGRVDNTTIASILLCNGR